MVVPPYSDLWLTNCSIDVANMFVKSLWNHFEDRMVGRSIQCFDLIEQLRRTSILKLMALKCDRWVCIIAGMPCSNSLC